MDDLNSLSQDVIDRLPRRFQLIIAWARYFGLDKVLGMRAIRDERKMIRIPRDGSDPAFYDLLDENGHVFAQMSRDLFSATIDYRVAQMRGYVYGPFATLPSIKDIDLYFHEANGTATTRLDLAMAIWRAQHETTITGT